RPPVGLRQDRLEGLANPGGAVVDGNDEADAFHHVLATSSLYTSSICEHTTSSPKDARTGTAALTAAARQAGEFSSAPSMARASASASPSGTTWPPPVARTTSPQPESSATMTGVPERSASSGTSPKI